MIRNFFRNGSFILSGWFPVEIFSDWNPDIVLKTNKTAKEFYERNREAETGWDRLYLMFSME